MKGLVAYRAWTVHLEEAGSFREGRVLGADAESVGRCRRQEIMAVPFSNTVTFISEMTHSTLAECEDVKMTERSARGKEHEVMV